MSYRMNRRAYAETFGPTVGDRVRLADTELIIEVEQDYTTYGDEVKFGGGKVIRDGMGQSPITNAEGAVDCVITNALILDWWGIVKADVGIKDGQNCRDRQGGQSLHSRQRDDRHWPWNRGDRRRRDDSDRRRHRHSHSLHLSPANRSGDRFWHHHA